MGRQKKYLVWKKHQRRRKKLKRKMKLYEQRQLKYEELPRLAREWLGQKRRQQQPTA